MTYLSAFTGPPATGYVGYIIEGVCIILGENFPPAAHEVPRDDREMPRVAAMWFPASGEKCSRCRNYTRQADLAVCAPCGNTLKQEM